jgi:hypothetical protein
MSCSTIILDQLCEGDPRLPAEGVERLGRIAAQRIDLGGPKITLIDLDVVLLVKPNGREGELDEVTYAVRLSSGDDVVVGLLLLQHQPHRLDIVAGEAPISLRFEVSQIKLALKTLSDSAHCPSHFTRHERLAATRTLMIE